MKNKIELGKVPPEPKWLPKAEDNWIPEAKEDNKDWGTDLKEPRKQWLND